MKRYLKRFSGALLACVMAFGLIALPVYGAESNQLVQVDIWHATSNKASMGNVATDNNGQALYNPTKNTLQVATNPVNVSGYQSAIIAAQYDTTGSGNYQDVTVISTGTVQSGTKYDGTDHAVTYLSSFEIQLPDYITGEGVEFIPLKMTVPYTPMDEVVGEGYLDARLRIDWSQVENTTLTEIQPDKTISSGEVESVERFDAGSMIRLVTDSAKVASTTTFQVDVITSGTDYDLAKQALSDVSGSFTLYDVKLIANSAETDPFGAISLIFPYSGELSMYRINDDGTKTVLRGTASDDGYEVMTTKVGLFAVIGGTKIDVQAPAETVTPTTPSTNTPNTSNTTAFQDISDHWAEEYIVEATNAGLFSGTSTTTFSPDQTMTSGMVITVLYRMAGSPEITLPEYTMNVKAGAWYEIASAWGYENEIIGGYKSYAPEEPVSRQELATMLYKYYSLTQTPTAGADLSNFSDAESLASWAKDGMAWANAAEIVSGTSSTTLSPEDSATRAQVATMLCKYLEIAK